MFGCCRFVTLSDSHHADSLCHASYACWCQRRSGDLHPTGCKAEPCSVVASMFVLSAVGMPMPRRRARKSQPRGTASSDLVKHEIIGIFMRRLSARLPDILGQFTRRGEVY
jgi:hypothetical protein